MLAASEARFPKIPINIIINVTIFGDVPSIVFFIKADNRPTSSATPIPKVITKTIPNGANAAKFSTKLSNIYLSPGDEITLLDLIISPFAGFTAVIFNFATINYITASNNVK